MIRLNKKLEYDLYGLRKDDLDKLYLYLTKYCKNWSRYMLYYNDNIILYYSNCESQWMLKEKKRE